MAQRIHTSVSGVRVQQQVILGVAVVVLSLSCVAQADMTIRAYEAKRHDRFYAGDDRAFIGQIFDWSGVGKSSDGEWVTMVAPSYFLSAAHYAPDTDDEVTFYEGNSASAGHVYTVAAGGQQISINGSPTDLWLGKLTTPLIPEDHINFYPILVMSSVASYLDMELFNYGKTDRVGRNVLDAILDQTNSSSHGISMLYDYDDSDVIDVGGDETFLELYDSGGPSFAIWNGELALLGIHWFHEKPSEGAWYSGDTFVPHYVGDINGSMIGETLTVVPEPSTLALWSLVCMVGLGYGWWRKHRPVCEPREIGAHWLTAHRSSW